MAACYLVLFGRDRACERALLALLLRQLLVAAEPASVPDSAYQRHSMIQGHTVGQYRKSRTEGIARYRPFQAA
eukprot:1738685-Rhodomonas_salina.2